MPRPKKKRTIFHIPYSDKFSPNREELGFVELQLDELEAIRLTDLEHLDQGECAARMKIARTTAQNIINAAHEKIADALVNGKTIYICGGDFEFVRDDETGCCRNIVRSIERIGGMEQQNKEEKNMKLAITYDPENGEVFQHFGRSEYFKVYDVTDGVITGCDVRSTDGRGHGALAGVLQELGSQVLICGGIGGGAQQALRENGIQIFGGVSGSCDEAAAAFVEGTLKYQEDIMCEHHDHEHTCHQ
ncbi:MAG: DUF134 domain-containing protein [Anaerovoracaceae bacterium]